MIKLSDIKQTYYRFDASYHLSDGVTSRRIIENIPYRKFRIDDITSRIFYGVRANRTYVTNKNNSIPFLTGADIMLADLRNTKLVSKKFTPAIDEMTLHKGWVLVTRSGTVGQTAWSNLQYEGKYGSEDIIRLIPNEKIKGGLLYAYLASKYGQSLLTQGSFGAVIQHIEPSYVGSLSIPEFPTEFQEQVHDLVQTAATLREDADNLLYEATNYFDEKIRVSEKTTLCFSKKLKSLKDSWASYNNNKEVSDGLLQYKTSSFQLKDVTSKIFAPPMFKHIYLSKDNGYPFLTGGELVKQCMRYYRWLSPRGVKNIKDYIVKKNTLLIYRHGSIDGGMNGQTFIVDDRLDGCCLSDLIIRVVFNEPDLALWTFAFLKSTFGKRYLLSFPSGTAIPFMAVDRVAKAYIPQPDDNYQRIITLVKNYQAKSAKSKELEIKAIELVEKEIEKWNKN